jgi:putative tryptophan/tyrosine transport system substrate-binding protein
VAWPLAGRAQQSGGVRRIGVLMDRIATDTIRQSFLADLVRGLRQLGWTEGQNLRIDVRWSAGDAALARTYAAQLIGLMPDVILASTTINLTVVQEATSTVPVVFMLISDPVAQGFVASMRQPGGNLTGFSNYEFSIGGRWLDLLKEVAPGLARVAVMFDPDASPQSKLFLQVIEATASSHSVQATAVPVRTTADIEPALESFARQPNGGLILTTNAFTALRIELIADLATRYRLPSIGTASDFAEGGGLMAYGVAFDLAGQFRQAASYVDRIFKGEKPGDLPVQGPTNTGWSSTSRRPTHSASPSLKRCWPLPTRCFSSGSGAETDRHHIDRPRIAPGRGWDARSGAWAHQPSEVSGTSAGCQRPGRY